MSTDANAWTLCAVHQDCSIPTDGCADASFNIFIAWKLWFILWRNSVDVIGCAKVRKTNLLLVRPLQKLEHQITRTDWASSIKGCIKGGLPFSRFSRICIY